MLLHDLAYGLRSMARRPGFAAIAVLTLAIGIGANTAIFTIVDRVLLRAVPFPDPARLVVVWETNPNLPVPVMVASPPTLHDWATRNRVFADSVFHREQLVSSRLRITIVIGHDVDKPNAAV